MVWPALQWPAWLPRVTSGWLTGDVAESWVGPSGPCPGRAAKVKPGQTQPIRAENTALCPPMAPPAADLFSGTWGSCEFLLPVASGAECVRGPGSYLGMAWGGCGSTGQGQRRQAGRPSGWSPRSAPEGDRIQETGQGHGPFTLFKAKPRCLNCWRRARRGSSLDAPALSPGRLPAAPTPTSHS